MVEDGRVVSEAVGSTLEVVSGAQDGTSRSLDGCQSKEGQRGRGAEGQRGSGAEERVCSPLR